MVTIITTHDDADSNNWKQNFDKGTEARSQQGALLKNLYSISTINKVTIALEMADADSAKAFIAHLKQIHRKKRYGWRTTVYDIG